MTRFTCSIVRTTTEHLSAMLNWVRGAVSKKKRRFQDGKVDLDLSYINERIIAMGYPAQGFEALYRNDFSDVREFLDEHHSDNYIVYNLCSERTYSGDVFGTCPVEKFPFDDHNPPNFDLIRQFCVHAADWLNAAAEHIIAVHCKAGKGRTGVMICALLVHMGTYANATDAMAFYGDKRTHNHKGVTIPSQRRYVLYYKDYLDTHPDFTQRFVPRPYQVTHVKFEGLPSKHFNKKVTLEFGLMDEEGVEAPAGYHFPLELKRAPDLDKAHNMLTFSEIGAEVGPLNGDFRITLLNAKKIVCFMWFCSTWAHDGEQGWQKDDVDKASKSKAFDDRFKMILVGHH
jgi:phosphatidylinositol-3,4,5-trisphosphate 3-phosphatase/dual-specificity protein phosphatase PTEN